VLPRADPKVEMHIRIEWRILIRAIGCRILRANVHFLMSDALPKGPKCRLNTHETHGPQHKDSMDVLMFANLQLLKSSMQTL
jgi:hypothetical protein